MQRVFQDLPGQLSFLGPLLDLSEILPHEEKLLSRIAEEIAVGRAEVLRLFLEAVPRHLLEETSLSVNHLVVREHELEVLRIVVEHGEGEGAVVLLPKEGIRLHVGEEVIHPAHVPL